MEQARNRVFPAILGGIILLVIGAALWWFLHGQYIETTDNAYIEADMAVIAPKVQGYVAAVEVVDNQRVKQGDVLARIVDSDYKASLDRADAEVERQRRQRGVAVSGLSAETSAIVEARASLAAAEAMAKRAAADAKRADQLMEQGWVTRAVVDQRHADAQSANAVVAEKRAAIASAGAGRDAASGQVGGAGAALKEAVASREQARLDLENTVLHAPFDGVIGNRTVRVGQYARTGQQMMLVVPVEQAYLVANFKETQVAALQPGMPVTIKLDAWPDLPFTGRIESFSPAAGSRFSIIPPENATGNFTRIVQRVPVRIVFDQPLPKGIRLTPGISAKVTVDKRDKPEAAE